MQRSRSMWWLYVVLTILLLLVITPFLWMILGSFKTQGELLRVPPTWLPEAPTFDNFTRLFERLNFGRYFFNSSLAHFFHAPS